MPSPERRPLAPAPSGSRRPPPSPPAPVHAKRNTSIACTACKARKQKCSGVAPCSKCVETNTLCEIDVSNDGRRRIALKRKLGSLEQDRELLLQLVDTLRSSQDEKIMELVDLIREGSSLDDIKSYLDDNTRREGLERTPEVEDIYQEVCRLQEVSQQSPGKRNQMDIKRLTDVPLFDVPAKPWTTVTTDDQFVSHLVSLWFTWSTQSYNWIDKDDFTSGMKSGDLNSQFCSPLLVCAMLAEACSYSDYPEAFAVPDEPSSRGMQFWAEAKGLLDAEEGRMTIPTVQGIGIMYSFTSLIGKDRLGLVYMVQAAEGVEALQSARWPWFMSEQPKQDTNGTLDRIELALFSATTASCLALKSRPKFPKPRAGVRLPEGHADEDEWSPYPRQGDSYPAHTHCLVNRFADLSEVSWDACHYLFGQDGVPPWNELEATIRRSHERLVKWQEDLPECLHYEKNPIPGVLVLHMYYHTVIMTIFGFIKTAPPDGPAAKKDSVSSASVSSASRICRSSAHAVARLMETHENHWGFEVMNFTNIRWITTALYTLMDDLSDAADQTAFRELCTPAISMARRWLLLRGMLRLVQIQVKLRKKSLPEDARRLFVNFERRYWRPEDQQEFSSSYPDFAASIREHDDHLPEDLELDKFLEKWESLTIP